MNFNLIPAPFCQSVFSHSIISMSSPSALVLRQPPFYRPKSKKGRGPVAAFDAATFLEIVKNTDATLYADAFIAFLNDQFSLNIDQGVTDAWQFQDLVALLPPTIDFILERLRSEEGESSVITIERIEPLAVALLRIVAKRVEKNWPSTYALLTPFLEDEKSIREILIILRGLYRQLTGNASTGTDANDEDRKTGACCGRLARVFSTCFAKYATARPHGNAAAPASASLAASGAAAPVAAAAAAPKKKKRIIKKKKAAAAVSSFKKCARCATDCQCGCQQGGECKCAAAESSAVAAKKCARCAADCPCGCQQGGGCKCVAESSASPAVLVVVESSIPVPASLPAAKKCARCDADCQCGCQQGGKCQCAATTVEESVNVAAVDTDDDDSESHSLSSSYSYSSYDDDDDESSDGTSEDSTADKNA